MFHRCKKPVKAEVRFLFHESVTELCVVRSASETHWMEKPISQCLEFPIPEGLENSQIPSS